MNNEKKAEMLAAAKATLFTLEFANSNIKNYLTLHGANVQSFNMKLQGEAHYVMKIADENAHYVMRISDDTIKEVSKLVEQSAELASKNLQEFIRLQKSNHHEDSV